MALWETGLFKDVFICGMGRVENDIAGNMEPNKKKTKKKRYTINEN